MHANKNKCRETYTTTSQECIQNHANTWTYKYLQIQINTRKHNYTKTHNYTKVHRHAQIETITQTSKHTKHKPKNTTKLEPSNPQTR